MSNSEDDYYSETGFRLPPILADAIARKAIQLSSESGFVVSEDQVLECAVRQYLGPEYQLDGPMLEKLCAPIPEDVTRRTANCLFGADIHYYYQLCELCEADLMKIHNFGRKCFNEVQDLLREKGLRLRMQYNEEMRAAFARLEDPTGWPMNKNEDRP